MGAIISDEQLRIEIEHIFDSGANEVRVFEMVKGILKKAPPIASKTSDIDREEVLLKFTEAVARTMAPSKDAYFAVESMKIVGYFLKEFDFTTAEKKALYENALKRLLKPPYSENHHQEAP